MSVQTSSVRDLGRRMTNDGWIWTERVRSWDYGQREELTHILRREIAPTNVKRSTGAKLARIRQALLALEYVELTDRAPRGFTPYRGGVWKVESGGLPGMGQRA